MQIQEQEAGKEHIPDKNWNDSLDIFRSQKWIHKINLPQRSCLAHVTKWVKSESISTFHQDVLSRTRM